jgi:hypothetical protein
VSDFESESAKLRLAEMGPLLPLLTVPVPYFMVVVGGLVPLFYILYLAVTGFFIGLLKFTAEAP